MCSQIKNIIKISSKLIILIIVFLLCLAGLKKINYEKYIKNNISTVEDVMSSTNFVMKLKKIKELEYTVQDRAISLNEQENYFTFQNNNKFDIHINTNDNTITSINYISKYEDINNLDKEYLQKIYTFIFSNTASFMFDKTLEVINNMSTNEYISNNKHQIDTNNYSSISIPTGITSEIKITTYYTKNNSIYTPFKTNVSILKGNKW